MSRSSAWPDTPMLCTSSRNPAAVVRRSRMSGAEIPPTILASVVSRSPSRKIGCRPTPSGWGTPPTFWSSST